MSPIDGSGGLSPLSRALRTSRPSSLDSLSCRWASAHLAAPRSAPRISCEETSLSCTALTTRCSANSAHWSSTSFSTDASDAFDPRLRFGMGNATHRQRWETRGPALSWVSRCAPAACGEGVTLPYGKPLPLEAAVEQEQEQLLVRAGCWSARRAAGPRARARPHARARPRARARTCTAVLRYTVLVPYWSNIHRISTIPVRAWGRIYIASARKCPY